MPDLARVLPFVASVVVSRLAPRSTEAEAIYRTLLADIRALQQRPTATLYLELAAFAHELAASPLPK